MRLIWIILMSTLLFGASFDDFSAFNQFEKMDTNRFLELKQKIQNCTKKWNFPCAENYLEKIKKYITKKSDNEVIASLRSELNHQKQMQLQAQERANSDKKIVMKYCGNGSGRTYKCSLYVNDNYDGIIYYYYDSGNRVYTISINGSKNAETTGGYYDPKLNDVWTTRCGSSVYGRSNKIFVYDLKKAMKMFANCAINGKY